MRRFFLALAAWAVITAPAFALTPAQKIVLFGQSGPVLSLNFMGGTLPSQVSFSRSSTATYFNSSGVLSQASSGVPRFDYNPSTLALNGLLIEAQSTNLALHSEDLSTTWTTGQSSVTTNTTVAPDGNTTADTITDTAVASVHYVAQSIETASGSTTYTASAFLKAGTLGFGALVVGNLSNADAHAVFTLSGAGASAVATTGSGFSSASATITKINNSYYRATLTATAASGQSVNMQVAAANGAAASNYNYTGTGSGTVIAWGAQFEKGVAFASSYIPTTTATVTRAADVATAALTGINVSQGTLIYAFIPEEVTIGGLLDMYQDGSNKFSDRLNNTVLYNLAGTNVYNPSVAALVANAPTKDAFSWAPNNFDFARNGTLSTHGGSGATFAGPATIYLGAYDTSAYGSLWFQSVKLYARKLPASQLQSLTH